MFERQVLICINVSDWLGTHIYIYTHWGTYHVCAYTYIYIYTHMTYLHVYLFKTFCTHTYIYIYISIYLSYLIWSYLPIYIGMSNQKELRTQREGCSRWMDCRNRLLEGSCDARLLRDRSRSTAPSRPSRCASWWGTVIEVIWLEMGCLKIIGS